MEGRLERLYRHEDYQKQLGRLKELEQNRPYCRHDEAHFLSVARLAWITCLEEGLSADREVVYAAALLHDLGKVRQYGEGIPHEQASALLAEPILQDTGFDQAERERIIRLILKHRRPDTNADRLEQIFYEADKASRLCYCCAQKEWCHWEQDRQTTTIR